MRKSVIALATGVTALALAAVASGAGMQKATFYVYDEFLTDWTTEHCGVETWIRFEGNLSITLFTDRSGTVVRELDTQPGFKTTFYSPRTGKSFGFPEAIVWHWEYPEGAYRGAPAKGMATGMHGRGGKVTDAGRVLFEGEVFEVIEEDGVSIPLVDFRPVGGNGRWSDEDAYLSGRCEALGGTYTP